MTKMKTTPGPWTVEPSDSGDWSVGLAPTPPVVFTTVPNREDRSIEIATVGSTVYDNSEDGYPKAWGDPDANARLIAAAPAMFDLLVDLDAVLDNYADMRDGADSQPEPNDALAALHRVRALLASLDVVEGA